MWCSSGRDASTPLASTLLRQIVVAARGQTAILPYQEVQDNAAPTLVAVRAARSASLTTRRAAGHVLAAVPIGPAVVLTALVAQGAAAIILTRTARTAIRRTRTIRTRRMVTRRTPTRRTRTTRTRRTTTGRRRRLRRRHQRPRRRRPRLRRHRPAAVAAATRAPWNTSPARSSGRRSLPDGTTTPLVRQRE